LTFAGYEQAIIEPFEAMIVPFERGGLRILRYPTSRQDAALVARRDTNLTSPIRALRGI
jgi:hypothetical protein